MEEGKLSGGHARALVPLTEELQKTAAALIIKDDLSVRQTELLVKKLTVENINGDVMLFAGNTIWLEIPGLAEISLQGQVLIENCTHIFEEGAHRMQLDIRIEEVG